MKPSFAEAKNFRMPWGRHKGQTLDEAASTDEGLRYLDWLRGDSKQQPLLANLEAYLDDPTIASDLRRLTRA